MDRIEEIKKRISDNVFLLDKHELNSLKKFTKTTKISGYEVLTDDGFVDIEAFHETIPYEVYHLKLSNGKELKCADNHIVFYKDGMREVFVKNLNIGDRIIAEEDGVLGETEVIELTNLGYDEVMYDLELEKNSNRRYYTNGILSHNTELAKCLAEKVFGSQDAIIRVDMSEYSEKFNISKLIGAPPGYVGYNEGGQLTEKVKNKPYSLVLFDEIEKAHPDIFNVMLQLLDEGYLTDANGRKINFKNTIIIMTSNIGLKEVQDFGTKIGFNDSETESAANSRSIIEKNLKKTFKPEFINRLDEIVYFNYLMQDDVIKIIELRLKDFENHLKEIGFTLKIDKKIKEFILEKGFNKLYGAREIQRTIQKYIEDPISDEMLRKQMPKSGKIGLTYNIKADKINVSITE